MNKCLEEEAYEFMLKPFQQSDVKKLRCHMMKFKGGYAWEGFGDRGMKFFMNVQFLRVHGI
ncbi:hypothetical protein ACSBR2_041752 [Camellia fascicularis]